MQLLCRTCDNCMWLLQAALADTSIPSVEVQAAEDPNDEPELEVLDDNAVKLDVGNVPITLTVSQVRRQLTC